MQEMIDDIDDHGFTDTPLPRKLAILNDVYFDVCAREPWPFLEAFVRLSFSGSSEIPTDQPTDFRAALAMKVEGGAPIQWVRFDDFERWAGSNTPLVGSPVVYYFIGRELHFYPIPTQGLRVRMPYLRRPAELVQGTVEANILLPWEFHRNVLVNGALYKLYALEDDSDLASGFQQYYEEAIARMREFVWKAQYDSPDIVEVEWEG